MRVAVVGASGKTGSAVKTALRARGADVAEIGRAQADDLPGAFAGCDVAYLIAPNMHEDEPAFVAERLDAVRSAGVGRVAYHSVAAPCAPAMPHHLGKARAEDLVRRSGLGWTILQPCAYVQNLLPALSGPEPNLAVPYDVDRTFGFVDLADVAAAAGAVLLEPDHHGATYELGGPDLVSVRDLARIASRVLGRDVTAERVDPAAWAQGEGADLDPRVRRWLLAMFSSYDEVGLPAGSLALRALLGRDPVGVDAVLRRELVSPGAARRPRSPSTSCRP